MYPLPEQRKGTVRKMAHISLEFFSSQVSRTVHAEVILPVEAPNYTAAPPFRTVYWLPGFSNGAKDILAMAHVREQPQKMKYAVVLVDGDNSFFVDRPMCNYSRLIGEELIEVTRMLFPLSHKREDTILVGNYMGGYGTLYNGLRYPDVFGKLVLLCPGLDFYNITNPATGQKMFPHEYLDTMFVSEDHYEHSDLNPIVALENAKKNGVDMPEIFYAIGRQDNQVGEVNVKLRQAFQDLEIPMEQVFVEGGHDMVFLENILPHMYEYLSR